MTTPAFDLIIRNGAVVDGSGGEPFIADIAISGDRIAAIGKIQESGAEEIDATGKLVTPGFVDIHTHYDGQAIWESRFFPSSAHGVTTVVMGNCGVGFAPCRTDDHDRLIELMEGVEDIPGIVTAEGLPWDWESYPDYLDAVEKRPHDLNFASYLPHCALRVYVMGERAVAGEAATPEDLEQMAALTREAMRAGAIGFSTSRTVFHRSSKGEVIPTVDAAAKELGAIAGAMQSEGRGVLEISQDFKNHTDFLGEFTLVKDVARAANTPLMLLVVQTHTAPEAWRELLGLVEQANDEGVTVTVQALPRGAGILYGLDLTMHPFMFTPSYQEIMDLPIDQRLARMQDPEVRARIVSEPSGDPTHPLMSKIREFGNMFEMADPLDYEPSPDTSIGERAKRMGISAPELAYDILVRCGPRAAFFAPFANYAYGNLDAALEMFRHRDTVLGLGDAGAHCGMICDASYPTFLLTHWTRDRSRGDRLSVPEVIKALTLDTATMIGLKDRGRLAPGYKADLNVIDYQGLHLHAPQITFDLPAGGRRLTQGADGYLATVVNGRVAYRNGQATGVLAGRLIRGRQAAPDPRGRGREST